MNDILKAATGKGQIIDYEMEFSSMADVKKFLECSSEPYGFVYGHQWLDPLSQSDHVMPFFKYNDGSIGISSENGKWKNYYLGLIK